MAELLSGVFARLRSSLPARLQSRESHPVHGISASGLLHSAWSLEAYPDVAARGADPIRHYVRHGAREGRDPNRLFNSTWYLASYPDVAESGLNPLVHFIARGAAQGRDPGPLFDTRWY